MVMTVDAVKELAVKELHPLWRKEKERVDLIDKWHRGENELITVPRDASRELRELGTLARTPWLRLIVKSVVQGLYVDSWKSPLYPPDDTGQVLEGPWRTWVRNRMPVRQLALHRAAVSYNMAYVRVLPGVTEDDRDTAHWTAMSPRRMIAVYADPGNDEWPMYALSVEKQPGGKHALEVLDEEAVYYLSCDEDRSNVEFIEWRAHDIGVCPVVRYSSQLDTEGDATGEVEPYLDPARRIDKTTYDRLLAQHYNSWKVRTATGMAKPETEEEERKAAMLLRQGDLLIGEDPETRFGTLDETPLDPFVTAWRADVEALAAVSQTPSHELTGQLVNLSAEALAAARAGLRAKTFEFKTEFGASHGQTLRLSALVENNLADAEDPFGRVTWQDMEVRSLAQASDALGKLATMLKVPPMALWNLIPGVERSDVNEWVKMVQDDPLTVMARELARQGGGNADEGL